jgi:hypothetical protein
MMSDPASTADRTGGDASDEQITSAIRRLFAPPAIWPPLFNDAAAENGSAHHVTRDRDPVERMDQPGDRAAAAGGRTVSSAGWRRAAIAACLALGLFGVWNIWAHFAPAFERRHSAEMVEVSELYSRVLSKAHPGSIDKDVDGQGRMSIPGAPVKIRLADAQAHLERVEFVGAYPGNSRKRTSPYLLFRIDEVPSVLFVGSICERYIKVDESPVKLHLHRTEFVGLRIFELTPHASPRVLQFLEFEDVLELAVPCASSNTGLESVGSQ